MADMPHPRVIKDVPADEFYETQRKNPTKGFPNRRFAYECVLLSSALFVGTPLLH